MEDAEGGAGIAGTLVGGPAYTAGIDGGDVITAIDGRAVANPDSASAIFASHKPGDQLAVQLRSRGGNRTVTVRLAADPALAIVPIETGGQPLTEQMRALRQAWLAPKAVR
jgi:S1-C subfamily serine protease